MALSAVAVAEQAAPELPLIPSGVQARRRLAAVEPDCPLGDCIMQMAGLVGILAASETATERPAVRMVAAGEAAETSIKEPQAQTV